MRYLIILLILLLTTCRSSQPLEVSNHHWQTCIAMANEYRQHVAREQVENAGFPAFTAAPFLHGTRFLDELVHEVTNDSQSRELLTVMTDLGDRIRRAENAILSSPFPRKQLDAIRDCSHLLSNESSLAELRKILIERLQQSPVVADHYNSTIQWLGLLPLLRPVFKWRIDLLHKEERQSFDAEEYFIRSETWTPISVSSQPIDAKALPTAYTNSALSLPLLAETDLLTLFDRYAPRLTIETMGHQDRPGKVVIENNTASINIGAASAYFLPSWTRFAGRNLLQLNYVFWFSSRESRRWIDLYSGTIDSLIWRVTLDEMGDVLLYDSIHSCGCYHKYFIASDEVQIRSIPGSAEPANIFDLTILEHSSGLRLLVTSNEHFIVGIDNAAETTGNPYTLIRYDDLYTLPGTSGAHSLFARNGIITGSERLERFTLWPTGIGNVGAMRQWGTHATGFVARQHFDDARLFDRYFTLDH
ncbi:MAG: hypothetical protein OXD01_09415 [Gammaproteobacteria bacterium]|nr:hypothetical protein [Gammaproteobacteria bacterium]